MRFHCMCFVRLKFSWRWILARSLFGCTDPQFGTMFEVTTSCEFTLILVGISFKGEGKKKNLFRDRNEESYTVALMFMLPIAYNWF